ncbi:MAG: RHS repeat domain-containing protein, partial [Pirellulales bacterium]
MPRSAPPSYRLHKPSGQAIVTLAGRMRYLGPHGTPASRAEYDRLVGSWLAQGRPQAVKIHELTVAEVALAYVKHAADYYRKPDTEYNPDGEAFKTTDPAGTITEQEFDDAGRREKLIENKISGTASDKNRTTRFEYNSDGLLTKLIAENATTGNQETQFIYGTSAGGITPAIYRNDLLRAVIYPDSGNTYSGGYTGTFTDGAGGYDRVEYKYNRQGQAIEVKDQNGTVHEYDYDKAGRRTVDRVATVGSGIDSSIRRIEFSYTDRGAIDSITSFNAATGGGVVNEVELVYNAYGQLQFDKQEHGGAVVTNTPKVEYSYADGSGNHVRLTKITYPNGRKLHFTYGSASSIADALSRVAAVADDSSGSPGTHLAEYSYLGLDGIVKVDLTEPDLLYTLAGGAGSDPYDGEGSATGGLDRFGRVVNLQWIDYEPNPDVVIEQVKHGYDRASNRLWRECPVPAGLSPAKHFDELYSYDLLYQLKVAVHSTRRDLRVVVGSGF